MTTTQGTQNAERPARNNAKAAVAGSENGTPGSAAPAGTGHAAGQTVTATLEQAIDRKRTALAQASASVTEAEGLLEAVAALPDTNAAKVRFTKELADAIESRDRLAASLANDERSQRTFGLVVPLISAFGTDGRVTVKASGNVRTGSIALVDVESTYAKAIDAAQAAADNLAVLDALRNAVKTAKIGDDVIADFRPVRFEADGEHAIKLAVSTGATRAAGTGTRASGRTAVEITAASVAGWEVYAGAKVGAGGDYESFTALGANAHARGLIDETRWNALKYVGGNPTGDARSVSWRAEMIKAGGFTVAEIATSEAAPVETAPAA